MTYNIDSNPAERQWLRTPHKKRSDSDLWKILGRSRPLEKAYKYVTAAEAAALSAKGVKIEETKRGKFRYEPAPQRTALTAQPEKIQAAVADIYEQLMRESAEHRVERGEENSVEAIIQMSRVVGVGDIEAEMIADELKERHGVKVHPKTVIRFLEGKGVPKRQPERRTASMKDVESRDKILDDMRGAIKDYGQEMDTLRDENASNKKHIEKLESNYTTATKQTGFLMSQLQKFTEMDRAPTEKEYAAILTEFKEMKHGEPAEPEKEQERQREPPETEGSTAKPEPKLEQEAEPKTEAPELSEDVAKIVKTLKLNFSEAAPVGADNPGGWNTKQEKEIIHNVNRFAAAAKKQYTEGDFKNAYPNMRNYAIVKNKLLGNPVDEFDLDDSLHEIDRVMRTTARTEPERQRRKAAQRSQRSMER